MPRRPRYNMTREERAKQFLPFSALHGLDQLLRQQEILTESDDRKFLTGSYLQTLVSKVSTIPIGSFVSVEYYGPENKYITNTGILNEVNLAAGFIKINNMTIDINDLYLIFEQKK